MEKLQFQIHPDLRLEIFIHKASKVLAKLLLQRFLRCLSFPASLEAAHETILENLAKFPWRSGQCKSPKNEDSYVQTKIEFLIWVREWGGAPKPLGII